MSKNKNRILIVDDEEVLSAIYKTRYESEGFEVEFCNNGQDALNIAKRFEPDVIVLDLMMPKQDGYEALKQFRAMPAVKDAYIIVYSALTRHGEFDDPQSLGADEFLIKSDTPFEGVVEHVLAAMKQKQSEAPTQ